MMQRCPSSLIAKSLFLVGLAVAGVVGQAQSLVQTPYVSVYAGIPATTYNGTTLSASICATAFDAYGDGCPAAQATLTTPRGLTTDLLGNAYVTEQGNHQLRVVYQGGSALAAALVAANPGFTFTPTAGNIYPLGAATAGTPVLFSGAGVYCSGTSGSKTLDTSGDGCPAEYFAAKPGTAIAIDSVGNIFFGDSNYPSSGSSVHIVYVGGTTAANLITAYNPSVTTPLVGHVYALSITGAATAASDFNAVSSIAVDANDNMYVSDTGGVTVTTGTLAATAGGQIKKFVSSPVAGWTTFITNVGNVAGTANGDGGPATLATVGAPFALGFDLNNNLYIADTTNESYRVVYLTAGSLTPPLYVNQATAGNANAAYINSPVVGDIYTVAGGTTGGSNRHTGFYASEYVNDYPSEMGFDQAGNLLLMIDQAIFRVSQSTGVSTLIAGGVPGTTGVEASAPAAGTYCNNGTTGPTMTNAYGDGCPGMQVITIEPTCCKISTDAQGNFYVGDYRASAGGIGGVIQKYTFNGQFGAVATGSSVTQPIAFTPTGPSPTPALASPSSYPTYTTTFGLSSGGGPATEFTDIGTGDLPCVMGSTGEVNGYQTCIYNIKFTPSLAGAREGGLTLTPTAVSVSGTPLTPSAIVLGGVGTGPQISVDPGGQTTIGSALTPEGVALDQAGNYYIASGTTTGVLYKSTAGGTPVSLATGFSSPMQVAVNGAGTVYVADSGNNRVVAVTQAGVVTSFLASFHPTVSTAATSLSGPSGVAVDVAGDVFVSDTGNNRVIEVAATGVISTLGFSGLSAPLGLAVDSAGDVFVADSGNKRVVELSAAGVQSAVSVIPALSKPVGVAVDAAGDLYIADSGNQNVVLVPAKSTAATTLLSSTTGLAGVAADNVGDVLAASSTAAGLVKLNRSNAAYTFPGAVPMGSTANVTLTLTDTGNATLTTGASLTSNTDTTDFSVVPATTNGCTTNASIVAGASCALSATFKPASNAGMLTDTVTFPASNAVNAPSTVLTGNTVIVQATTVTITPSANPAAYGSSVTFTVGVTAGGTAVTTGTVTITQNGVAVATNVALTSTATYTATGLIPGTYSFGVSYSGAYGFAPTTGGVALVVSPPAADFTLSLSSTSNTVSYGNSIIDTLTVTPLQYSGYNLVTTLTCTGVPYVSTCTVVPGTVTPNGVSPVTAVVTLQTGALVAGLRTGHGSTELALIVLGAFGLLGLGAGKRRRWPVALALLLCLSALAGVTGCSNSNASTYTLTIHAVGTGGQTHTATWTVNVTQ